MRISDWSSDVCSSDLRRQAIERLQVRAIGFVDRYARLVERRSGHVGIARPTRIEQRGAQIPIAVRWAGDAALIHAVANGAGAHRTEERRVGKGGVRPCRSRGPPYPLKKKKITK